MNQRTATRSTRSQVKAWPLLAFLSLAASTRHLPAAAEPTPPGAKEIVLVTPAAVTERAVAQWKQEHFRGVAVWCEESVEESRLAEIGARLAPAGLDGYAWIEVAHNTKMATAHPRWMAALGMHQDWQKNFPNAPEPKAGEVAKAFPWVPIGYRESFEAHVARIESLLKRIPSGWRGVFLNDLQGGPSSCGCGNLQCRWAIDYGVRSTATKLEGDNVAARFVAEVQRRAGGKLVIPVWTTECEEVDLPPEKHQGQPGTGLCGTVGCAVGACPEVFTRQWSALVAGHNGPIALLGLHTSLQRTRLEFGGGPAWAAGPAAYLRRVAASRGSGLETNRLWVVVEGVDDKEEAVARERAGRSGAATIIVSRAKLDQAYEPRMIPAK